MAKDILSPVRRLSRQFPSPDDLHAAFSGLRPHAIRGVVLVAAAQLDFALMVVLNSKFRRLTSDEAAYLFGSDGPYATTSTKIHVAYSLNIIGKNSKRELQVLSVIRNAFAHAPIPVDFSNKAIQDACNSLETIDLFPEYKNRKSYLARDFPWKNERDKYITGCRIYSDRLLRFYGDEQEGETRVTDGFVMFSPRTTPLP